TAMLAEAAALGYLARMNSPTPAARGGVARVCRYLYRVPLLLVHLVVFLPLTLLGMLSPWGNLAVGDATLADKVVNAWSGGLMWIFGFRLVRKGTPLRE